MREKQIGIKDILFAMAVSAFLITVILDMSLAHTDGRMIQILRYAGYVLVIVKLLHDVYDRTQLTMYFAGFAVLLAGFVFNHNKVMILYSLVIMAAISINEFTVLKIWCIIQGLLLTTIILFSQLGFLEDYLFINNVRTRHFLGFAYTTTPPILFLFVLLEYICLRGGALKAWEFLAGVAVSVWLYIKTDTNFAFWISMLALFFFLIFGHSMKKGYITYTFRKLLVTAPWIMALVSIAAQFFFNPGNELHNRINNYIHGRLYLGKRGIESFGFHLFGSDIEWIGNSYGNMNPAGYNYVDSSYLQLALQQGIVFLVIVLALYSYIIYRSIKCEKYYFPWVIMFVLLLSVTEPRLVNPVFNPFIMLAFCKMEKDRNNVYG